MHDVQYYKSIFDKYGGMMRTTQLAEEKILYPQREKLIADGYVEKSAEAIIIGPTPTPGIRLILCANSLLCMEQIPRASCSI